MLALLDGLFENAPIGFTYVDTDLRYRRVNAAVAELNGGSVEQRVGRTIDEVHGEPCGPQFSAVCRDVIRTGRPRHVRVEGRLWHGNGPHQVWRMNYYPVFGPTGQVIGVGDVFVDVTEAERIQRELDEQSAARQHTVTRYESLIEATSAAVWIVDAAGRPAPDNPSERTAGFLSAVHPSEREALEGRWWACIRAGEVFDEDARLRVPGGVFRHFRIRAVPVIVEGRLTEWIGTETDIDAEVRARGRLELLALATDTMNRALEPEAELQSLAEVLVPTFADGCTVHLLDPLVPGGPITGRRLLSHVRDGVGAPDEPGTFSYPDDHPFMQLALSGAPVLLHHPLQTDATWARSASIAAWERRLGWHTTMVVPIRSGGAVTAALTFVAWGDRGPFTDEDLTFVGELAKRASSAVTRAQLFQDARRAALTLQQAMLTDLPVHDHVQIEARYEPAQDDLEVGGDWYDAFVLPGGDLGLVVGDVLGHDLRAATVMGQLRSMFRGIAMDDAMEPDAAVERLNQLILELKITKFTTVVYARLHTDLDGLVSVTWSSAGHPPAMVAGPGRTTQMLTAGAGMALGIMRGRPRQIAGHADLHSGRTLLLYTDGLVERRGHDLDVGTNRLRSLTADLADEPLDVFCDGLLARSGNSASDDIALLAVRVLPAAVDSAARRNRTPA